MGTADCPIREEFITTSFPVRLGEVHLPIVYIVMSLAAGLALRKLGRGSRADRSSGRPAGIRPLRTGSKCMVYAALRKPGRRCRHGGVI